MASAVSAHSASSRSITPTARPSPARRLVTAAPIPRAWVRTVTAHDQRLPVRRLVAMPAGPEAGWSAAANPLLPVEEMRALLDRAGIPDSWSLRPPPLNRW